MSAATAASIVVDLINELGVELRRGDLSSENSHALIGLRSQARVVLQSLKRERDPT